MSLEAGMMRRKYAEQAARWRAALELFTFRSWAIAAVSAAATLVLIGIPTNIIPNPFFTRMLPVRPQDYVIWVLTGLLAGLVFGTYALPAENHSAGRMASGGVLSFLAVGCPICNKLVVLVLGVSGALSYFAPLQIYLGLASLLLMGWALHLRVRAITLGCPVVPVPAGTSDSQ